MYLVLEFREMKNRYWGVKPPRVDFVVIDCKLEKLWQFVATNRLQWLNRIWAVMVLLRGCQGLITRRRRHRQHILNPASLANRCNRYRILVFPTQVTAYFERHRGGRLTILMDMLQGQQAMAHTASMKDTSQPHHLTHAAHTD
jgi:hypothetical protein